MQKIKKISPLAAVGFKTNNTMNKRMTQKKLLKRILYVSFIVLSMSLLNCPPVMAAEATANAAKAAEGTASVAKAAKDIKKAKSVFKGLKEALLSVQLTCLLIPVFGHFYCEAFFKNDGRQLICWGSVWGGGALIQLLKRLFL